MVASGDADTLHPLVVSVQEKHHGAAGLDHEAEKNDIRDEPQEDSTCKGT